MNLQITFLILNSLLVTSYAQGAKVETDNSAINERDKYIHEYTADEQGKNKEDTEITQLIRKEIIRDKSLSLYAHNIKIITMNGQVTLKGPVRNASEAKAIVMKAQKIAGASSVLNQIDIVAK